MGRHLGRGAHHTLHWVGGLLGVPLLLLLLLLWRLTLGPIELDRLTPYVEDALNQAVADRGLRVQISGVRFGIDREEREFDLQTTEMRLLDRSGRLLASLPAASASFSLRGLLRGVLAPTRLIVSHPSLLVARGADGALSLQLGDTSPDAAIAAPEAPGPSLLDQLALPQPRNGTAEDAALSQLRRVTIRNAEIAIDDERAGRRWQISQVDADLQRMPSGIAGTVSLALPLGSQSTELKGALRYDATARKLDARLDIGALSPAAAAALSPELAPLKALGFPIQGGATAKIDVETGALEAAQLDLGIGRGTLASPDLPDGGIAVTSGEFHAAYVPEAQELRLTRVALDLGDGSLLQANGALGGIPPGVISGSAALPPSLAGSLDVSLSNVPVSKLPRLWPASAARGGREWVLANIREGVVDETSVRLRLNVDTTTGNADVPDAQGTMRYHDLSVSYFKTLPAARKVTGTAVLSGRRLEFKPTAGAIKAVQVAGGSIAIDDLGGHEILTIDVPLSGPVRDVLEIIDSPPLRYAHEIGVEPAKTEGKVDAQLHFKMPLLEDITFDQIAYAIKAKLAGVTVEKAVLDRDLTEGNITLDITNPGLNFRGRAKLDGNPATLDGTYYFKPKNQQRARYHTQLTLGDAARQHLGVDYLGRRISGPVGVDLTYDVFNGARAEAAIGLDLGAAALEITEAGWKKPAGMASTARLTLDLLNDEVNRLRNVELQAPTLDAKLGVVFGPDHRRIDRIDIQQLSLVDSDLRGAIIRRNEGGWRVELRGKRLDLTEAMKEFDKPEAKPARNAPPPPPLLIDAQLDRLTFGKDREARNVAAQLFREGRDWKAARIEARFPNGHALTLRFTPGPNGLVFVSDDFGSVLQLLDVSSNIKGGKVNLTGQASDRNGRQSVQAHVEADDYTLIHAPTAAKILSLASFSGVANMLSGEGVPFTKFIADLTYGEDRVTFRRLQAYGGAIGVNAQGDVDLGRERIDLSGTVVPAYMLNSILSNIPVLGSLLMGGDGQGLFGANFRLSGSLNDPQTSVNALSALAPGFLRQLFTPNAAPLPLPPP